MDRKKIPQTREVSGGTGASLWESSLSRWPRMVSRGPHEVIRMMIRGLSTPQDNSVGLMKMI